MNHTETTTATNTPNATRAKMKKGGPRFKLSPLLYYVPFSDKRETPETALFWKTGRREYYAPMTREEAAGFLAEYYAGWPEDEKALGKALAPYGAHVPERVPGDKTERRRVLEKTLEAVPDGKLDRLLTAYLLGNLALLEIFVAGANHERRKVEAGGKDAGEKRGLCVNE
ncbi:MAG: hypothetical protein IKQ16_00270 [Lentisphaeria bacterium]|nr:hypothetical protein [Lentisphaeria bacterium]